MSAPSSIAGMHLVPILAGGGSRLSVHVGVLAALDDLQVQYKRLIGVSGGSIVAALRAAGWSPSRLLKLALDVNFNRFRGRSLIELVRHGGLASGDVFEQWLDEILEGRCFSDLDIDLAVVATDVRFNRPVVFERKTTPTLKVSHAVRCSMGIPLLFSFKPWEGGLLVDGSILSEDALHRDWAGDGTPVCVFRLRSDDRTQAQPVNRWFPLAGYVNMLIRTFMTTISREFVDAKYWPRTVVIASGTCSPLEFKLDRTLKLELYHRGYDTTLHILPRKFEGYAPSPSGAQPTAVEIDVAPPALTEEPRHIDVLAQPV